jgi:uncharacterized membrane protein YhhN
VKKVEIQDLTPFVCVSLALHLRAEYFGPAWQVFVFKPLTTSLIIAMAVLLPGQVGPRYRALIVLGLLCSLAGDTFLMLPGDRFVLGLASFLLAHLCYITAFVSGAGVRVTPRLAAPYVLYDVAFMAILWPTLGPLTLPVTAYGIVLAVMGWQAAERWAALRTSPALGAAVGGALFLLSDSVLAVNRFVAPFRASRLLIMTTYIAAQWLIARSVAEHGDIAQS